MLFQFTHNNVYGALKFSSSLKWEFGNSFELYAKAVPATVSAE